jgi:hypothetical protein
MMMTMMNKKRGERNLTLFLHGAPAATLARKFHYTMPAPFLSSIFFL